jgi:hypothetical protein
MFFFYIDGTVVIDEFHIVSRSNRCLFLKGARLINMKQNMDFISRSDELSNILLELKKLGKLKKYPKRKTRSDFLRVSNDPRKEPENQNLPDLEDHVISVFGILSQNIHTLFHYFVETFFAIKRYLISANELMTVRYLNIANPLYANRVLNYISDSRSLGVEKLKIARNKSKHICGGLNHRQGDVSKNIYLLQCFFLCCLNTELSGFTERVLFRSLWATSEYKSIYLNLVLIVLFLYALLACIGLYSLSINAGISAYGENRNSYSYFSM